MSGEAARVKTHSLSPVGMRDQIMSDAKCVSCDINRGTRLEKMLNAVPAPCIALPLLTNVPFQLIFRLWN
jgi:hypothetical protein